MTPRFEWIPPGQTATLPAAVGAMAADGLEVPGVMLVADAHWEAFVVAVAAAGGDPPAGPLILVSAHASRDPDALADTVADERAVLAALAERSPVTPLAYLLAGRFPDGPDPTHVWHARLSGRSSARVGIVRPPGHRAPDHVAAALLAGLLRAGLQAPTVVAGALPPRALDTLALDALKEPEPVHIYDDDDALLDFDFVHDRLRLMRPGAVALARTAPNITLTRAGEPLWTGSLSRRRLVVPLVRIGRWLEAGPVHVAVAAS